MEGIPVWTRQHIKALAELNAKGQYMAKRDYVRLELGEQAPLVLAAYDWLARHSPDAKNRPAGAELPVWVSLTKDTVMPPSENTRLLELRVDPAQITPIDVNKWTAILNYAYLPKDQADAERHRQLLAQYNISDATAYLSRFYPGIRQEISLSWDRLFQSGVDDVGGSQYGIIWEVRQEWIISVSE